jgi:hypothetical protein
MMTSQKLGKSHLGFGVYLHYGARRLLTSVLLDPWVVEGPLVC